MARHGSRLTSSKAKQMLKENRARGKPLSARQKRFFGFIAGGGSPTKLRRKSAKRRR